MNQLFKGIEELLLTKIDPSIDMKFIVNINEEYLKFNINNGIVYIDKSKSIVEDKDKEHIPIVNKDYAYNYFRYIIDLSKYLSISYEEKDMTGDVMLAIMRGDVEELKKKNIKIIDFNDQFEHNTSPFVEEAAIIKKDILIKFVKESKTVRFVISTENNIASVTNEGVGYAPTYMFNQLKENISRFIEDLTDSEYYIFYIKNYKDEQNLTIPTLVARPYTMENPYIVENESTLYPSTSYYLRRKF